MKLREEFEVSQPVADVWSFLDRPESVAGCVPGVEALSVLTPDDIDVRIKQSVGPMTATFAANVRITDRDSERRMAFTAVGKSVRGAAGNVRADVVVGLRPSATGTVVDVEGDVALAGALGSVGQKVVAKQAGKVTAQFARNLEAALGGAPLSAANGSPGQQPTPRPMELPAVADTPPRGSGLPSDAWVKALVALNAIQVLLATLFLVKTRRAQ
ncbi:CoxG family protein [Mycolicibacterium smegmatis]|uniref:Carbon monoxide dehydrogenase subunit G (CoxG) family protein n=1 Tax=Mycolicibacterium smegmatis (strain MKD8) TaxID=1214915 RepID=A0A2U9PMS7_MYCSE|nr:SRPBCC family protein [Mycolicibacterium smegmatis]AWT53060.1 carbon monoxide dehydrogenase subunit G (CoxG) family protein [Mycolicibacterium smegmatis MKD8]